MTIRRFGSSGTGGTGQPADPDLTAIAALDSSTAGAIASDGSGWIKKTYGQFKTALGIGASDLTATGTPSATTFLAGNNTWATPAGGGGGAVSSVNTETGAVVLDAADVGATRLTVNGTYNSTYDLDTTAVTPADIGAQPADSDLTAIAGLTATTDNFLQAKASAWASRTPAQVATDLQGTSSTTLAAGNDSRITGAVQTSRTISTTAPLTGGGDLSANRTLGITTGTTSSTVAAGDDSRITGAAQKASNLSDLASASTARTNLGLGGAAVLAVGTASSTVAAGDDGRFTQVTANTQTASYTLVLSDAGKAIEMNVATANTLTIPTNASVAFPIGTVIEVCQYGAGQTTIAGSGVTLRSSATLLTRAQYSTVSLRKRGTDEWVVAGDAA